MSNFLKLTYNDGKFNFHTYILNASNLFSELKTQLVFSIFLQRQLPESEMRIYWIDDDKDEIDILDQQDYEIFNLKIRTNRHIYVAPKEKPDKKNADKKDNADANTAVHNKVECDGCQLNPIVGNRYKCMQCNNYDLCSKCEAKGIHAEHMMLRISNPVRLPLDADLIWSCPGLSAAKRNKRNSGAGIFEENPNMASTSADGKGSHGRHHRRHSRSTRNSGIFANICDMMQHLAEGGFDGNNADKPSPSMQEEKVDDAKTPPKTPPPTPTPNVDRTQSKKEATTNTSPGFEQAPKQNTTRENVFIPPTPPTPPSPPTPPTPNGNFVDPQYMRAGIQILSNFSEMFSKMLDPNEGKAPGGCPFNIPPPSGGPFTGTGSFNIPTPPGPGFNIPPPPGGVFTSGSFNIPPPSGGIFTSSSFNIPPPTGGHHAFSFSTSTDNGNIPHNSPFPSPDVVNAAVNAAAKAAATAAATAAAKAAAADLEKTFGKKANATATATASAESFTSTSTSMEAENQSEEQSEIANNTESNNKNAKENNRKASNCEENDWQMIDKTLDSANASVTNEPLSMSSTASLNSVESVDQVDFAKLSKDLKAHVEKEKKAAPVESKVHTVPTPPVVTPPTETEPIVVGNEEKRAIPVYHPETRINNAVVAMMAMGFSNEGGWLTQLLESVNGNIPQALDTMSAAQQNRN